MCAQINHKCVSQSKFPSVCPKISLFLSLLLPLYILSHFLCSISGNLCNQIYCINSHVKYFRSFSKHLSSVLLLTEVNGDSSIQPHHSLSLSLSFGVNIKYRNFWLKIKLPNMFLYSDAVSNKLYKTFRLMSEICQAYRNWVSIRGEIRSDNETLKPNPMKIIFIVLSLLAKRRKHIAQEV